jgi:hypothetical protein
MCRVRPTSTKVLRQALSEKQEEKRKMPLKLKVTDTKEKFAIEVVNAEGQVIYSPSYYGGKFSYQGEKYFIWTPYLASTEEDEVYKLYKLVPVEETTENGN